MATFTVRHEIACDADRFFQLFFDKAFNERMFAALEFPAFEVVRQDEDDEEIRRIVRATPKLDLPGPVAKALGAGFSYTEEGRYDRGTKTWRFGITPGSMGDKVKTTGIVRCENAQDGKSCTRVCEFDLHVKIFGIGGLVESALEKNLKTGWGRGADFMNQWLRSQPHSP
jgi:hypothetical protein